MGTEDWVLKGTKLVTSPKKLKLYIYSKIWNFKNTMLKKEGKKKKKQGQKILKNIYMKFDEEKKKGNFLFLM